MAGVVHTHGRSGPLNFLFFLSLPFFLRRGRFCYFFTVLFGRIYELCKWGWRGFILVVGCVCVRGGGGGGGYRERGGRRVQWEGERG